MTENIAVQSNEQPKKKEEKSDLEVFRPPTIKIKIGDREYTQTVLNFDENMEFINIIIEALQSIGNLPKEQQDAIFSKGNTNNLLGITIMLSTLWKVMPDKIFDIICLLIGQKDISLEEKSFIRKAIQLKDVLKIFKNAIELNDFEEVKQLFFELGEKIGIVKRVKAKKKDN